MKQLKQSARTGLLDISEVPIPAISKGQALVRAEASLISSGTERAVMEFAQKNLFQKAKSRPDLVHQVMQKVQRDGLLTTLEAVRSRLDQPLTLGYSCAGTVIAVGQEVREIKVGDRVSCAGSGYACHAEVVAVPKNLIVCVPEGLSMEEAAFGTVGAIALQGLRVADVRVGERVLVIGLGLVGLLTAQILKAAGASVIGTDVSLDRVELAKKLGADPSLLLDESLIFETIQNFTSGRGADAVIITAATQSNQPIELAGRCSRLKGRVVVVGDVRMDIPRRLYYEKELEVRVSMSYGPGRYDPSYEERGVDYPYHYVPFTAQRNMETFLRLVSEKKVTLQELITHRFSITEAEEAYGIIKGDLGIPHLGVIFTYPREADLIQKVSIQKPTANSSGISGKIGIGVIGAGNYAQSMLLPKMESLPGAQLLGISASRGLAASEAAKRFGFEYASTDNEEILKDDRIHAVVIATRHGSHAALAASALKAGKHVFVEKPLAINEEELKMVTRALEDSDKHLMVGFNRRFAPLVQKGVEKFRSRSYPLSMIYRVNAGAIPLSHWAQDVSEGGGRIVGEACHFIDLMQYFCQSSPKAVFAASVGKMTDSIPSEDIVTMLLEFEDGSLGTVHYFANGDKALSKEYLEVYGGGKVFILEDFRQARYIEAGRISTWKSWRQDKGQANQLKVFLDSIQKGKPAPIPMRESVLATLATFRIRDSLRLGKKMAVGWSLQMSQE